jgi:hypothetical protein
MTAALRWPASGLGQSARARPEIDHVEPQPVYPSCRWYRRIGVGPGHTRCGADRAGASRTAWCVTAVARESWEYLATRLGHLDYECFGLILVDGRHCVIDCVELFRGTIDGASVYPREVVKLALDKGAAAAVAYHNHPSGVKDQSHADELITKRLAQSLAAVDVKLLDHLILAGSEILSFAQVGLL